LQTVRRDRSLQDLAQINARVAEIEERIWQAVENSVPVIRVSPYSKHWWTESLTELRKEVRRLARQSYRIQEFPELDVHRQHKITCNRYSQAIKDAKRAHWEEFLERIAQDWLWAGNLWVVGKYLTAEPTDGGATCVPDLHYKSEDGTSAIASDNMDKSQALLDVFFPPPASDLPGLNDAVSAPLPVPDLPDLTLEEVTRAILHLTTGKCLGSNWNSKFQGH
jgi:hypothetical protein